MGNGYLHALYPDGTLKWQFNAQGWIFWGWPVVGPDGTIYCPSTYYSWSGAFYALNPDGTVKWSFNTWALFPPSFGADGTVYLGSKLCYRTVEERIRLQEQKFWGFFPGKEVPKTIF